MSLRLRRSSSVLYKRRASQHFQQLVKKSKYFVSIEGFGISVAVLNISAIQQVSAVTIAIAADSV